MIETPEPLAYAVMHSTSEYDYRIFATHDEASGFAGDCAVEEGDDDPEIIALYPLSPPDTLAAAEIEATWRLIENEYDIEPRAQIEAEAKTNGFKYGLAQAIHTIWKRDPKVADLAAAAEEAVKEFRNLASLARANCNFFIAARMETAADRLAAAIEKRGK